MDIRDLARTLRESKSEQQTSVYQRLCKFKMDGTNTDEATAIIQTITTQFENNVNREYFLKYPVFHPIIDIALSDWTSKELFNLCGRLLQLVLQETPDLTNRLTETLTVCFHKQYCIRNIDFFILLAQMCSKSGSAQTVLNSIVGPMMIKFYRTLVVDTEYNSQFSQSLDFEQFMEYDDDQQSDTNSASQMSSLSLEEDAVG